MTGKFKTILMILCFVFLTGCNNQFAEQEYDSNEKIAQTEDRYAKEVSVFNSVEGGYTLTVSKFDGRETLWTDTLEENQDMEMEISFRLTEGQAKLVHIDGEGNVTTIMECTPETSTDGFVAKTVSLTSGVNRLKIVGYDCEEVELTMLFAREVLQTQ